MARSAIQAMEESVTKDKARLVSAEISEAVKEIVAKHGLKLTKQSSAYGDVYKFTIEAVEVKLNKDGINLLTPEVVAYERFGYTGAYELPAKSVDPVSGRSFQPMEFVTLTAKIGTHFVSGGKTYAFGGVRSRGKKKIIGVEVSTKTSYVFADSVIPKINEASK